MFVDILDREWVPGFEAATPDILAELDALGPEAFEPWPERHLYGAGWNAFGFRFLGRHLDANCARCPKTAAALGAIPGLISAGFSLLEPGTWIKPHVGYSHSLYVGHLGLIVPEDCAIRVGRETRSWRVGRFFAFNDMVEHEAWNRGDSRRVVLLIEFLRPGRELSELTASPEVEAMLKALDPVR
jgi:beta-hydroxylase